MATKTIRDLIKELPTTSNLTNLHPIVGTVLGDLRRLTTLPILIYSYSGSLDAIDETGIYRLEATTGGPSGGTLGSYMFHLKWDANAAHQLIFHYSSAKILYRVKSSGTWQKWLELSIAT